MIVEIKTELFNDLSNLKDINYLLTIFSEDRRFDFFCEFSEIQQSPVFQGLISEHKELIEENFNRVVNESITSEYCIGLSESEDVFNITEAKRFFTQPFLLILENNLNDGYFVDALIKNFKNKSKIIKRHKDNGWLQYGNGGGCGNISNFIEAIMQSFEELPKENNNYLRCFVLIDSDKKFETNEPIASREALFVFLRNNGIPYHELEKREIENYIPDEVIEAIPEIDEYLQTYIKLTPIQKDYFDLEKGFNNKSLNSYPQEVQDLYSSLSEKEIGVLRKGMTIDRFKKFKSEFPKLFTDDKITQITLNARTKHQRQAHELQSILEKISKFL